MSASRGSITVKHVLQTLVSFINEGRTSGPKTHRLTFLELPAVRTNEMKDGDA